MLLLNILSRPDAVKFLGHSDRGSINPRTEQPGGH